MTNKNNEIRIVRVVPCEVYSRVVGYYRPVQGWNDGKKQEFQDRKTHKITEAQNEENQSN